MALQERYGDIVEAKLRSVSVFANIANRKYEGSPKAGAVKVPVRAECTVAAYTPATGLAGTDTATTFETIAIDNDYAVNEIIDGYEAAAVPDGKVAERLDSAGYGLGKKADDVVLAAINHKTGGNFDCKTAASTAKTKIVGQLLDTVAEAIAAGVDQDKIWIVVKPAKMADLLEETLFVGGNNIENMMTGQIGALAGTPVFVSNNSNFTDNFIVGNSDFVHYVEEFVVEPYLRDGQGNYIGSAQVVGRLVCGAKVTKAATVLYK